VGRRAGGRGSETLAVAEGREATDEGGSGEASLLEGEGGGGGGVGRRKTQINGIEIKIRVREL